MKAETEQRKAAPDEKPTKPVNREQAPTASVVLKPPCGSQDCAALAAFEDKLLPEEWLQERWGLSAKKLQRDRQLKQGVPFIKIGALVRYSLRAVLAYEKANSHPGSPPPPSKDPRPLPPRRVQSSQHLSATEHHRQPLRPNTGGNSESTATSTAPLGGPKGRWG